VPPEAVEAIAKRAAELVLAQQPPQRSGSPYLNADEAAAYLRCGRQRIYDLASAGRLRRYRDGTRVLFRRDDLDAHVGGA
jgi:excisionase family DNA binding protein